MGLKLSNHITKGMFSDTDALPRAQHDLQRIASFLKNEERIIRKVAYLLPSGWHAQTHKLSMHNHCF